MIRSLWRLSTSYLRQPFRRCPPQRLLAVATTATAVQKPPLDASITSHARDRDDQTLRQIFDSHNIWKSFSKASRPALRQGLFQNSYLTEPSGFFRYAEDIQRRCQSIVQKVVLASSTEEYIAIPRQLDLLSDLLCRVLDVADFVRVNHPDTRYQAAASQSYAFLFEYMNVLNTTPLLKTQLQKSLDTPEVSAAWSTEERIVAQILLKDFSRSAIDLPRSTRQSFVELSNTTKELGHKFEENMAPRRGHIELRMNQLKGMDPTLLANYSNGRGQVMFPTVGNAAYAALQSAEDEGVREAIYVHGRQSTVAQIQILERLMETRVELARVTGFQSYAHMSLTDKLAQSPEAVNSFLNALSEDNAPRVNRELGDMRALKRKQDPSADIKPWDVNFYRHRLNGTTQNKFRKPDSVHAYFSLGTVMQGLSRLFSRLYGIRFVAREAAPGEAWNDDVRRLDVHHETQGHVAVLYCDLFARAGKSPNPTHFTLRCSRRITLEEITEATNSPQQVNDGMAVSSITRGGAAYQLPTIALICDFPHPPNSCTPTLLNLSDVSTLFHEMGHAIHSILGRTSLQIVSGTRVPADFAELPSVLMEFFAADRSVLNLFARHWETDAPLPYELVDESLQKRKRGQGLQTETQILYSLLDQAYHSADVTSDFDSSKVLFNVYDHYGSLREPRDTFPQGFFGHLVEYGGSYYSYLFDRAIAGKIWRELFRGGNEGGGIDRAAGEQLKEEVLSWGGGRNGWECISGVLGDERLKNGGKEAMEEVGRWGVHD
ncbi:Mitochondrial intermediate peptidase [Puttea exsequens]|nr:Mitochondrial intermediate peptidase [Puttea exsequens]